MEETDSNCQETSGGNDSMEMESPLWTSSSKPDESYCDLHEECDGVSLSPDTNKNLKIIIQDLKSRKAFIGQDEKGRQIIQHEQKSKVSCDASKANAIIECGTADDLQKKTESFLKHTEYLKTEVPPAGIVVDKTQVHINNGMYREGNEFEKTGKVLGTGGVAGDIVEIKDKKSGMKSARKTIMLNAFREEEIKANVDLAKTGFAPALHLFKMERNRIEIYMEIISEAFTLQDFMDKYLIKMEPSLAKKFSLYILHLLLEATRAIHDEGWINQDLHAGNIMMQRHSESKLRVRILDFGKAQKIDGSQELQFKQRLNDIMEVLRIFSALYCGEYFDSALDLQQNWETKIKKVHLADKDKDELSSLLKNAVQMKDSEDVPKFHELVKEKLRSALPDAQSQGVMMRKVLDISFPDNKDDGAIHDHQKEESRPLDAADSVVRKPTHSANVKHHDVAHSRAAALYRRITPLMPDEELELSPFVKPLDSD